MCKNCYKSPMGKERRKEQDEAAKAFRSQQFRGYEDPTYIAAHQRCVEAGEAMSQLHRDYTWARVEEQAQTNVEHNVLDKIDSVVLGQRLKEAREKANITARDAARHVGASSSYINSIEAGRIRIVAGDLFSLAQLYRTQVSLLLNGPLPYTSSEQAIKACIDGEIGEGALATFLGVDRLETRRKVQEYEREQS